MGWYHLAIRVSDEKVVAFRVPKHHFAAYIPQRLHTKLVEITTNHDGLTCPFVFIK